MFNYHAFNSENHGFPFESVDGEYNLSRINKYAKSLSALIDEIFLQPHVVNSRCNAWLFESARFDPCWMKLLRLEGKPI